MKANDYLLNQITVCSRQSLLDIYVDFLHDAQHPTCNGLPKLDAPFPLDPVPNDLSPKGHDPITVNISPIEKCAHLKPLDIFTTRKPWAPSTTPSPAAHCPPAPIPTR